MAFQGLFTGGVKIRNLNGYLIAVNGEVFATTNTGGTTYAFFYQAKTSITSGDPGSGHIIWNNATQTSATQVNVSHLTDVPVEDIDIYLTALVIGNRLIIQDRNDSERFQIWTVSGTPTEIGSSYWTIPVTLVQSQGAAFTNNHDLLFAIVSGGSGGGGTTTNAITFNNGGAGAASGTSFNGGTAVTISYNTIGAQVASANLTSLAGLSYASTAFVKMTGANTFTLDTNTYLTANQTITLSGNVTGSGTTSITTTIANNVVTNAMLAQIATARIKGRVTAATGNVEDLTGTQVTTLLDTFTSTLKGLAPASGGGTTNFLRADGTWAAPPGGGGTPGGSNTQVQYNNSGAFAGSANFTWDNTNSRLYVNGNVGIYNASPIYALSVGDGTSTRQVVINGLNSGTAGGSSIAVQTNGQTTVMFGNKSNVTGGAYDGQPVFGFGGSTNSLQFYNFNTLNIPAMISSGDRFLIGTTTDNGTDRLQVNGSAIATTLKVNTSGQTVSISSYYNGGTGGHIWIGGGGLSSNSTAAENTAIGLNAMLNNTSGYYNAAVGSNALVSNTTGFLNMAFGAYALRQNTTGNRNMAIGQSALENSNSSDNSAVGSQALIALTSGGRNVAIGSNALFYATTGSSNVALGAEAGKFISGGSNNVTSGTSIYIGDDTRASANGNTNEIVIGHNAIGQGSNTVTLGNSSITQTLLRGTVTGGSFVKSGGTSSQILAADGSVITAGTGITISGGTISSTGGGGGTTTFAVTFNNSGTGAASGTTFDGSVARTISYNTLGANKVITSGTAAPTGGVDGDIYLQYDVSLLTGSGTTNYIPKFTSSSAIGNSQIFDDGTNVGINRASPTARLDVAGVFNGTQATFGFTSGRGLLIGTALNGGTNEGTTILNARGAGAGQFLFQTDGNDRFRIDTSGNLGIGTIPSAWRSGARALQFGANGYGALWEQSSGAVDLAFAAYENGTNTFAYTTTGDTPTLYQQVTGVHLWANASSGTAGNTITWNERMRISAAGNVGINQNNPAALLHVNGTTLINGRTSVNPSGTTVFSDRLFEISGTAGTTGTTQYAFVQNPTFGTPTTVYSWYNSLNVTSATTSYGLYYDTEGGSITNKWGLYFVGGSKNYLANTLLISTTTDNGVDRLQVNGNVTATQYSSTVQTLTDGATITFNANNGSNAVVTLGGNRTLAFSNTRTGAYYTLRVIQDGTGSRTLAMPGTVKVIGGGAGVITLSTAANSVDIISFYFDGTNYWASYGQNYT